MKRELARQEDRPPFIIIGLNEDEISQIEYEQDEINRLKAEKEELTRRHTMELEEQDRRHNMEIEKRDRRLDQTESLEIFRDYLSLECPRELSRKTTILECASRRERQECREKNCSARTKLISFLYHFLKK